VPLPFKSILQESCNSLFPSIEIVKPQKLPYFLKKFYTSGVSYNNPFDPIFNLDKNNQG
jgi:hypothetical protein